MSAAQPNDSQPKKYQLRFDILLVHGVGSSHFTRYHADYNTGARSTIYSGGDKASYLMLPANPSK